MRTGCSDRASPSPSPSRLPRGHLLRSRRRYNSRVAAGLTRPITPAAPLTGPALGLGWRRRLVPVIATQPHLLHFLFYYEEVVLGQQVQVALEGHIPVFRRPASHVVQAVGQEPGLNILGFVKDEFRFDTYSVGPAGIAFLLPGRFAVVFVGSSDGSRSGEAADARHVKKYSVANLNSLHLTPVLRLQA